MNTSPSLERIQAQRVERFLQVFGWLADHLDLNVPPIVEMEHLRSLPPGTLGHTWAEHLDVNGLDPFVRGPRRQQLHDGIHVLTGYSTDPVGEAEVQAFLLGAKFRLANLLIGLGLLRAIQRQRRHQLLVLSHMEVRSRLRAAYRRGHHSCFDPDTWQPEELWARSLKEVQTGFGV